MVILIYLIIAAVVCFAAYYTIIFIASLFGLAIGHRKAKKQAAAEGLTLKQMRARNRENPQL